MGVKPMNCPGHFLTYASEGRSYRDLPIRYRRADAAAQKRGVRRPVRADARPSILAGRCALLRYAGADRRRGRAVDPARAASLRRLRSRLHGEAIDAARGVPRRDRDLGTRRGAAEGGLGPRCDGTLNAGDGAFYGPKIDFDITDAIGRKWQCATIQLDYQQPENFDLKHIGADNAEHRPVVIHRAIFGSFERFIALLIEHYAEPFPMWLAPCRRSCCRLPIGIASTRGGPRAAGHGRASSWRGRAAGKDRL